MTAAERLQQYISQAERMGATCSKHVLELMNRDIEEEKKLEEVDAQVAVS
jgi:hypothetical protein